MTNRFGAVQAMREALGRIEAEGCRVMCGGVEGINRLAGRSGHFVEPTIVRVPAGSVACAMFN
ncbi:MAG: hypothetical protein IH820_09555 [Bacteroidetes bacterium]|nr:hypothetical protein [Bacteroidota bacterium]